MNPQVILTAEITGAAFGLISLITSLVLFRKTRRLSQAWANFELRLDEEINELSTDLDTASRKSGEHGCRIAWLETRVRSAVVEPKPATETVTSINTKPTITERRHRVLSLARRGQDPQTIARTLGMPHGEVELMINLGRAA